MFNWNSVYKTSYPIHYIILLKLIKFNLINFWSPENRQLGSLNLTFEIGSLLSHFLLWNYFRPTIRVTILPKSRPLTPGWTLRTCCTIPSVRFFILPWQLEYSQWPLSSTWTLQSFLVRLFFLVSFGNLIDLGPSFIWYCNGIAF